MKLLLLDDHVLFAKSLSIALSDFPEIESFSSTKDITHLKEQLSKDAPDILLMDINLGSLAEDDGLVLARHILEHFPDQKIVILSGYDLPAYHKEAEKIGAKGFVGKDIEPETLVHILLSVQSGISYFPQEKTIIEELTDAEKQVLALLAAGVKRKDIAKNLFMSERTVSNHLQHIFEKLHVSSAIEAVSRAIQMGYVTPDFTRRL